MSASWLLLAVVQALGWSLLHFVWQALLVGALYALARTLLPRGNPRYIAALLALMALAVAPVCTAWHELATLIRAADLGDMLVTGTSAPPIVAAGAATTPWLAALRAALPWLVLAWACGVLLLGARVLRQWRNLRAIVRAAEALPVWQERARALGEHMGLAHAVRVLASVRIATPTLVGWVRPVVVLPLAMLARMPVAQVDLILAHELAHLRRFDHIANLCQVVLETLFFYHPVVHWISRDARNERELCCDALALQASGGSRRDFVAALAELEEFRCDHADLALAASGGVLVERAWFIAGATPQARRSRPGFGVLAIALLCVAVAATVAWRQDAARERMQAALATSTAMVQGMFAVARVPMPAWHEATLAPPQLLPVGLAPVVAQPQTSPVLAAPVALPAAGKPALSVPDLVPVVANIEPQLRPAAVVPAERAAAAPGVLSSVPPTYPPQALMSGLQGQVVVQFSLDAAGAPRDLQVVQSTASGVFDAAALQALARWRFVPPADGGRRYLQSFTFQLGDAAGRNAAVAHGCLVRTGTHICMPMSSDTGPGSVAQRKFP